MTNQIHSAFALLPVQEALTNIRWAELDRLQRQTGFGGEEKVFCPIEKDSQPFQPAASLFTEWNIQDLPSNYEDMRLRRTRIQFIAEWEEYLWLSIVRANLTSRYFFIERDFDSCID